MRIVSWSLLVTYHVFDGSEMEGISDVDESIVSVNTQTR